MNNNNQNSEKIRQKEATEILKLSADVDYALDWWLKNFSKHDFYKVGTEWGRHNYQNQDKCSYLLLGNKANTKNDNHSWYFSSKKSVSKRYEIILDVEKNRLKIGIYDNNIESWKERKQHPVREITTSF